MTTGELVAEIAEAESQLAESTQKSQELTAEPTRRQTRLNEIPGQIAETNEELQRVKEQQEQSAAPNESASEIKAREILLAARRSELQNTVEMLSQEAASYATTAELLPLQQQLVEKSVTRLRDRLSRLKAELTKRKRDQAADSLAATQQQVAKVPNDLKPLATANVELAESQRQFLVRSSESAQNLVEIDAAHDVVEKELAKSIQRVDAVGLTDALGAMFRSKRDEFQQLAQQYRPDLTVRERIESLQTDSFRLEDEMKEIDTQLNAQDERQVDWSTDSVPWSSLSEADAKWVLLKQRRRLLGETLQSQNLLLQAIIGSDTSRRKLATAIEKYDDFVNRRLFWTRSAPLFSPDELTHLPAAIAWIFQRDNWASLLNALRRSFTTAPLRSLLMSLIAIGLIVSRPRTRRAIVAQGKLANRSDSSFRPTFFALGGVLVAAAAWPAFFAAIAYLLMQGADNQIAQLVGRAFTGIAVFVASRELLREICREGGLADAHLEWPTKIRRHLRFHLHWYTTVGAICIFLMVVWNAHPDTDVQVFGTRLSATVLFLTITMFHHVVFRPKSPLYADVARANPHSKLYRHRKLVWAVLVLLPLSFSALAMAGYIETVLRLGRLVQLTLLWLLTVLLMLALVYRWISLHRRDLARMQKRAALEKRLAAASDAPGSEVLVADSSNELEETDLPALDQKTRKTAWVLAVFLAIIGISMLWRDILPAFEYFGGRELWRVGTGDNVEVVSLLDVLMSGLVIAGLIFAARNFVSLLELVVLSRTSLDSGSIYALSMILYYVLFVIGIVAVFSLLSIPVQQLAWLVAAVSFGIGFGLQEIIANFVCGIILLLERPVRVGDVVSIGDTTGKVSKIQMRATTVTNWDRKELVIPNKDLITGKVLNWSLSNVVNRLTLNVGVQYGADPDKVRDLLKNVVDSHEGILKDPAPAINLESFGDSSLNFIVRIYLPSLDNRISMTHEINTAIARAFSEADIEIPFPQRDVNLSIVSDIEPILQASGNRKPISD